MAAISILLLTCTLFLVLPSPSCCDTQPEVNYYWCGFPHPTGNYTLNSTFDTNLNALLTNLSTSTPSSTGFSSSYYGVKPDTVYGLALCRGDTTPASCGSCLYRASTSIQQLCPYFKSAIIWYDDCELRYSNTLFAGTKDDGNRIYMKNSNSVSAEELPKFNESVVWVLDKLRVHAVHKAKAPELFAMGTMDLVGIKGREKLYGLVQCTRDIAAADCDLCLKEIFDGFPSCCTDGAAIGGRVVSASCNFRYETGSFFYSSGELILPLLGAQQPAPGTPPPAPSRSTGLSESGEKKKGTGTAIAIGIPVAVISILLMLLCCICFRKTKLAKTKKYGGVHDTITESLLFDLRTIKRATSNFSESNKLGEGGFGSVYQGVLTDGQEIAVKRITNWSVQGVEQLKNEVLLLAKLQHRNLVRILGVCFEEHEKIIIYEFTANKSMDTVLFDAVRKAELNWETRYKIITGIARGLQYLHEESQVTIIHRDLKASNVLLDNEMNPKISDFGTARLFGGDQTQLCTNTVIGTFGYMPPEYVMRGQFSNKTDVFSFGLVLLEIVTGCKNSDFFSTDSEDSGDLLSYVWKHWTNGTISEIVDPSIKGSYRHSEVQMCIHIGLLCVQEFPNDRPAMSSIVLMLSGETVSAQVPSRPAFLRSYSKMGQATSSSKAVVVTTNEASITEMDPR